MPQGMLEAYFGGPPSLADRLLAGTVGTSDTVKARKQVAQDMFAEWQSAWDRLSSENEKR